MLALSTVSEQIAKNRKSLGLSQSALAVKAHIGRSTLAALENGRLGELGYTKIANILAALDLELRIQKTSTSRPTLDDLLNEGRSD